MCNKKWYDIVTVIVSVLVGAAAVAYSIEFGFTAYITPRLAIVFGSLALLLLTFASCSLLRQDSAYNSCLCGCGHKLLLTAIALLVVATVTLIALETGNDNILRYILAFLLGALMSGTAFTVTGLLSCLVEAGCPRLRLRAEMTLLPLAGPDGTMQKTAWQNHAVFHFFALAKRQPAAVPGRVKGFHCQFRAEAR